MLTGSGHTTPPHALAPHLIDVGFVSEQEKHDAMAGALAFCHPSLNESLGIVILESWLAHTPVLVRAQCEVLKYHCEKSNGGLWFSNYPEFEEELLLLLEKRELAGQLSSAGRDYVLNEYSPETIDHRFEKAIAPAT